MPCEFPIYYIFIYLYITLGLYKIISYIFYCVFYNYVETESSDTLHTQFANSCAT